MAGESGVGIQGGSEEGKSVGGQSVGGLRGGSEGGNQGGVRWVFRGDGRGVREVVSGGE